MGWEAGQDRVGRGGVGEEKVAKTTLGTPHEQP